MLGIPLIFFFVSLLERFLYLYIYIFFGFFYINKLTWNQQPFPPHLPAYVKQKSDMNSENPNSPASDPPPPPPPDPPATAQPSPLPTPLFQPDHLHRLLEGFLSDLASSSSQSSASQDLLSSFILFLKQGSTKQGELIPNNNPALNFPPSLSSPYPSFAQPLGSSPLQPSAPPPTILWQKAIPGMY